VVFVSLLVVLDVREPKMVVNENVTFFFFFGGS